MDKIVCPKCNEERTKEDFYRSDKRFRRCKFCWKEHFKKLRPKEK